MELKRITVKEIEDYLLTSSPIFGLPNFKDILRIHVTGSYYRVMCRILEDSIKELDRKSPLFMRSSIYVGDGNNRYEFTDNLDLYLNGGVSYEYLTLIPTSIVNLGGSLLNASRTFQLNGNVLEYASLTGVVMCEYLARHPFKKSKHQTEDEFTDDSTIYGISYMSDYVSDMFLNIVTFKLINYIIELKSQVNYTELPIEIFSGLLEKKNELDTVLNEYFLSPTTYGDLWR